MKTSELVGTALDWAVAIAEGKKHVILYNGVLLHDEVFARYSRDWSQGGPIIEREKIFPMENWGPESDGARAYFARSHDGETYAGPTPLIAAMRAFVASKLGAEVEIPEKLQ